ERGTHDRRDPHQHRAPGDQRRVPQAHGGRAPGGAGPGGSVGRRVRLPLRIGAFSHAPGLVHAVRRCTMGIIDVGGLAKGIKDFATEEYRRFELESESKQQYPVNSARRAVCYAAKIYNFATDGGTMDLDKIDYLLWL